MCKALKVLSKKAKHFLSLHLFFKTAHARFFILLYAALHRSFAVMLEFWHDLGKNLRYI